ncbi:hypothetical protein Hypma_006989 [Hypsizygus marmoreus]|uniref:Uncharacterized protein n=1 Tax=Hypsizygus marmoreus TaxID=39966 RepID=A0A369KFL4_HYPMA|nr:hypothetical protein Hypma_006989 [Hypsizygus marmoreus]
MSFGVNGDGHINRKRIDDDNLCAPGNVGQEEVRKPWQGVHSAMEKRVPRATYITWDLIESSKQAKLISSSV